MLKANIKKQIPALLFLILLCLSGCSNPEKKKAQSLEKVAQLRADGDYTAALAKLESLSSTYPEDSDILQQIGSVHEKLGNKVEAAFYLDAAFSLTPDNLELLYQNYRAQEVADQSAKAYQLLEKIAADYPAEMNGELWLRLGELHAQAEKTQSALDAYMKGITYEDEKLDTETVITIGTLFKQLDNLPQAERWLTLAANSTEPNALPALFGLLEIYFHNENQSAAEKTVSQLDSQFPGAIDASKWANIRNELKRWSEDQDEMDDQLPEFANAKAVDQLNKQATDATVVATATSGKMQFITDIETAKILANAPAREMNAADEAEKPEDNMGRINPDPNIIIMPAEPQLDSDNTAIDRKNYIQYANRSSDFKNSNENPGISSIIPKTQSTLISPLSANRFTDTPQTLDDLLEKAEIATFGGDYQDAIRLYREALEIANDRADLWNTLSNVYLIDGQEKNATTAALEATRLDPENVEYVLDYLRMIQRTKRSADFLAELETAYDRFPKSPEITLSLARAYRRIDKNIHAAKILYNRFIELAPDHPLRAEAEAAQQEIR